MSIFAISDLHLSFGVDKPMNIFGKIRDNYEEIVKKNWITAVKEENTVIIPGDISWAMTLNESVKDFEYIDKLPDNLKKYIYDNLKNKEDLEKLSKIIENYFRKTNFPNSIRLALSSTATLGKKETIKHGLSKVKRHFQK